MKYKITMTNGEIFEVKLQDSLTSCDWVLTNKNGRPCILNSTQILYAEVISSEAKLEND